MPTEEEKLYIKRINLRGFKSIENLTVDFEKGLNILIGKNASGKSNFLEAIDLALLGVVTKNSFEYVKIEFSSPKHTIVWEKRKNGSYSEKDSFQIPYKEKIFVNGEIFFDNSSNKVNQNNEIIRWDSRSVFRFLGYSVVLPAHIPFSIPTEIDFVSESGYFRLFSNGKMERSDKNESLGFLDDLVSDFETKYNTAVKQKTITQKNLSNIFKIKPEIKSNLKKYTPIQDIRFSKINLYKNEKSVILDNIKLDFKINNNWVPWSQLSDGTKRLFHIITEITDDLWSIVLLEEPEIGIHPHQFNLLMEFLKEKSKEKQIVISTHSPQTLNCLNENELNQILITSYDSKKGTQMKHLTKPQTNKAKKYMKEVGFLSDYWMLSDLE